VEYHKNAEKKVVIVQNCQPKYKESKPGKQTKSLSQPSTSQSMLQIMGKKIRDALREQLHSREATAE